MLFFSLGGDEGFVEEETDVKSDVNSNDVDQIPKLKPGMSYGCMVCIKSYEFLLEIHFDSEHNTNGPTKYDYLVYSFWINELIPFSFQWSWGMWQQKSWWAKTVLINGKMSG